MSSDKLLDRFGEVAPSELADRQFNTDGEPNAAVTWNSTFPKKNKYVKERDTEYFDGIYGIYIIDHDQSRPDKFHRFQYNENTYICYEFIEDRRGKITYINYIMSSLASGGGAIMLYDFLDYLKSQGDSLSGIVVLTPDPNLHRRAPYDKLIRYYLSLGFTPTVEKGIDYTANIATIQHNIIAKISAEK